MFHICAGHLGRLKVRLHMWQGDGTGCVGLVPAIETCFSPPPPPLLCDLRCHLLSGQDRCDHPDNEDDAAEQNNSEAKR